MNQALALLAALGWLAVLAHVASCVGGGGPPSAPTPTPLRRCCTASAEGWG